MGSTALRAHNVEHRFAQTALRSYCQEAPKSGFQGGPTSPLGVLFFGVTSVGLYYYYRLVKDRSQKKQQEGATSDVQSHGRALLGGPFELVDSNGRKVTSEDFKGRYMLLYFGFTNCPDICPGELEKIGKMLKLMEADKDFNVSDFAPVFISVDPHRDSPAKMKTYGKDYDRRITWLTGSAEQVKKATKHYRVYFSQPKQGEDEEDYQVDHSIITYIVGPDGEFIDFYGQTTTAEEALEKLRTIVQKQSEKK